MSVRWITRVWDESPYEGARLLIHLAMADHANDEGWFFMAQTTIARKARCSVEYVRKTVQQMQTDGVVVIERKGHSKGKATEYRLLPNKVGQSAEVNSPTTGEQLPNSEGVTPQLHSATSVTYIQTTTTTVAERDTSKAIAHQAATEWWESLSVKPIGKNAWWSLLRVCEAAAQRDYSQEQIVTALIQCGTVPSILMMDKQLKGITPKNTSARQQRLARGMEAVAALEPNNINPFEVTA